jgi:hypothetical protein
MHPSNEVTNRGVSLQTENIIQKKNVEWNGRIVVLWSGLGEYAWSKRLEEACKKLNWECITSIDPAEYSEYDRLVQEKASTSHEIQELLQKHKPDCVISLKWDRIYSDQIPHYLSATGVFSKTFDLVYTHGVPHRLAPEGGRMEKVENPADVQPHDLLGFNGILNTTSNIQAFENFFVKNNKPFHTMLWYPSSTASEYKPVEATRIFHCGFQWDSKRNGPEYRKMFSLLDNEGFLDIYGPPHKWDCAPNSVRGMTFIEEKFREAMRASGIVLILHSDGNLKEGAPAARIFEAASAGCVIICDQHPFIMREFGDSVLYVDHTQLGDVIFKQITDHRQWILSHAKEAEAMAKKAHGIFSEKFTLEKQLENFKTFHLKIQAESLTSKT